MSDIAIKVTNLCKDYKGFSVKDVSFELPKGYIMGFIGPNGAGKSTTIKCIMNLAQYTSGNINILGMDIKENEIEVKQKIGYVSDEQHFYEDMTVGWTGNFVKKFYKNWDDDCFNNLLSSYNISSKKKIKELSKGMKMKFSLALALSHHPEVLIMDEPTSGLDPLSRSEFLDIMQEQVCDGNCSVFFSSHITEDLDKVCDYITLIKNGQIVLSDEKDTLLGNWKLLSADLCYINEPFTKNLIGLKKSKLSFSGLYNMSDSNIKEAIRTLAEDRFENNNVSLNEFVLRMLL